MPLCVGVARMRSQRSRAAALAAGMALAFALSAAPAFSLRLPEEAPGPRVLVNALWNRDYLCLSARVPDPMLTGSSTAPMSAPELDDAIEFCFEIPGREGSTAHRLVISVAGGMTLLTRDGRGHWRADTSWISGPRTLKYAVSTQGTRNDPSDEDAGFTVECAIPWEFLGGEPPLDREVGFNVVCWMQGENDGVVSWSPSVTTPAEVEQATRWGKMLVSVTGAPAAAQGARVLCPHVPRTPFIDGKLSAEEWLTASTLQFSKPESTLPPASTAGGEREAPASLLAIYRYDWQGDAGRTDGSPLWGSDGAPATRDQPRLGAGPWYSYDRVEWHRAQLDEVRRSGVDVILARYSGDQEARRTWARAGLDRLAQALKELRAEGLGYPLVGMQVDMAPLREANLKSDSGRRLLYGMIRDFFLHMPREFWAEVGARPNEGRRGGVPVLLGEPEGLADWDGSALKYCEDRFAEDFGGARVIWLGSSAWRTRGAELYAYVRLPLKTGYTQEAAGGPTAVGLSPGYCPPPGMEGQIRSRRERQVYQTDWQRALAAKPELVFINSWNDFANGTEIAPSRQYGVTYVDATRYFQSLLGSKERLPLRLKTQSVPRVLRPGTDYQVELVVENLGTEDIRTGRRVSADYRIRRADGKMVQEKTGAQALVVRAGETRRLPAVIATRDSEGKPLPPGEYLFSLAVTESRVTYLRSKWFARTVAELTVPITVGETPARQATIISTSLPSSMEAGASEQVIVRLRNDGDVTWRANSTSLSYHWLHHEDDLTLSSAETRRLVAWQGTRAALPKDVTPGETVSVMIEVRAVGDDGSPLRPVSRGELWHHRVQWDLVEGEDGWFSQRGAGSAEEAIQVVARERGVLFVSGSVPAEMEAGSRATGEVVVANAGSVRWEAGRSYLTQHWYRWDGREAVWEGSPSHLTSDVLPGEKTAATAELEAPSLPGPYWLVCEMVCNGEESGAAGGRRKEMLVVPVMVRSDKLRPLDLSPLTNVVAVTADSHRARGDFDGRGRSLPAEWLPPDQSGARADAYPSGYYSPGPSEKPVLFAYPNTAGGLGGAVACMGQSVPLGEGGVARVHLLAASTADPAEVAFGLNGADGRTEEAPVRLPSWTEPEEGMEVGAYAPYVRTLGGDDTSTPAYLYHVTLSPTREDVTSLQLPRDPRVKILAITAEMR